MFNLIKWNTLWNLGQYLLSFVFSIILARFILPEEYGLTGMISIFTVVAALFVNSGFSTSIIRNKTCTDDDYSTIFFFNIGLSFIVYILLCWLSIPIANFYDEPELKTLLPLISIPLILNSFNLVQNALLIKSLNLKKQAIVNLSALTISIIVGCCFVWNGFGIYSIVAQLISQSLLLIVLHWSSSLWRPKPIFRWLIIRKHWKFSSNILFTSLFNQIILNIDNMIIGKLFSTYDLGIMMRAKSSKNIPENIVSGTISTVSFSVLSKSNENQSEFDNHFIRFFNFSLMASLFVSLMLFVLSEELIMLFYGLKWQPSIELLSIYASVVIPSCMGVLYSQTLLAQGNSRLYFYLSVLKRLIIALSIIAAFYYSIKIFLIVLAVVSWIAFAAESIIVFRFLKRNFQYLFKITLKLLCIVFLLISSKIFFLDFIETPILISILIKVTVVSTLFLICLRILFRQIKLKSLFNVK